VNSSFTGGLPVFSCYRPFRVTISPHCTAGEAITTTIAAEDTATDVATEALPSAWPA